MTNQSLPKLRDLPVHDRLDLLAKLANLGETDVAALRHGLSLEQADHMIENVVTTYALPMGIVTNLVVNGREVLVPMVVEEPSIVAGCSFAAKLARAGGGFTAAADEPIMIGQIQVLDVPDMEAAQRAIAAAVPELIEWLNVLNPPTRDPYTRSVGIETRIVGGEFDLRPWSFSSADSELLHSPALTSDSKSEIEMLVVHVLYHAGDAMGANMVNTACESLAPKIEALTGGRVNLRILSNLADRRLAHARCVIPAAELEDERQSATSSQAGLGKQAGLPQRIQEASLFAELDPYRAATHNKGIMNGIDAVALATGNDWRAIEAGAHAYAARNGRYASLTRWRVNQRGDLTGEIELPLAVGMVGGATRVHPAARAALKIMGVQTARELAEVMACVGLAQNFAAVRALANEGIQRGHMTLHARQVAMAAGATGEDIARVAQQLVAERNFKVDRAKELLAGKQ
ncbi:MAG: hydroxymethylglutaryl-CoA reductase [Anaerolineae bacterium]|nr:hydroxymethylglutaryl-CoA reductase [Thermoflexales bacterium]MDW8408697.1 hydroxymethylglutaryl-CoA reductase [Anaerolineae bacterium]